MGILDSLKIFPEVVEAALAATVQGLVNAVEGGTGHKEVTTSIMASSISITRVDSTGDLRKKFAGKWFLHGTPEFTIDANLKSGIERKSMGPCNYDYMCTATYTFRLKISGDKLIGTYTDLSVVDDTGAIPFDISPSYSERVGKSFTVSYVHPGLLKRKLNNVGADEQFGNRFLCNKKTSLTDQANCGA